MRSELLLNITRAYLRLDECARASVALSLRRYLSRTERTRFGKSDPICEKLSATLDEI